MISSNSASLQLLKTEVLSRVMPGLRHSMLGKLQPIALLSQILSKKIDVGSADLDYIKTQVDEIKLNARLLTGATQNLFSWMDAEHIQMPADILIKECLDLLKMECYSKHLQITNHVTSNQILPAQLARVIVCAVIIMLADKSSGDKLLDILMMDDALQFTWNEACEVSESRNEGKLQNWDWIHDIPGEECHVSTMASGIRFHFINSENVARQS